MNTFIKKHSVALFIAGILLVGSIFFFAKKGDTHQDVEYPEVLHLDNREAIENKIKEHAIVVLFVHMDKCRPCKKLAPVINQLGSKYEQKDIFVCKVNRKNIQPFCEEYEVVQFPSVLIYKDGKIVKQFVGCSSLGVDFFEQAIGEVQAL